MAFDCFNACPFIREENGKAAERGVWRSTDGAEGAKQEHDALEALYHPYVDFDGVNALCALETARVLRDMQ